MLQFGLELQEFLNTNNNNSNFLKNTNIKIVRKGKYEMRLTKNETVVNYYHGMNRFYDKQ